MWLCDCWTQQETASWLKVKVKISPESHLDIRHPVFVLVYGKVGLRHCGGERKQASCLNKAPFPHQGLNDDDKRPKRTIQRVFDFVQIDFKIWNLQSKASSETVWCVHADVWKHLVEALTYFDMKLQVLIHGVNVVEDVLNNPGDDSHHVWVMKFPL